MFPKPDGGIHVAEACVASPGEGGGRADDGRISMEEEFMLVSDTPGEGGGLLVGTFRALRQRMHAPMALPLM